MKLNIGYHLAFDFPQPAETVLMLHLHPSEQHKVRAGGDLLTEPFVPQREYLDSFGNRCTRVFVPAGRAHFRYAAVVEIDDQPDPQVWDAAHINVQDLPNDVLQFLLPSRYCEVDTDLKNLAWQQFAHMVSGWLRVQAICNFVHNHIRFDYLRARANRTAMEVYRERVGVCRDYTHLAVTLCRCLNIPARYCTGYLGDINIPPVPSPMDFCAWFEAYLGHQWYVFDPRNNVPRVGRLVMARGRDAADVALTTTFGLNTLATFQVGVEEVSTLAPPTIQIASASML